MGLDVAGVRAPCEKASVAEPSRPTRTRFVNEATPLASVFTVVVPVSVIAATELAVAVTATPLVRTLLPKASCRRTFGCTAVGDPDDAVPDGCCIITSF